MYKLYVKVYLVLELVFYGNAKIYLPRGYYFSFANSPYYAHQYFKAVDIYPVPGETTVASPFNGKLVYYKVIHGEHVSGYRVGDYYVRLLHLKPLISIGEEVGVGDLLGELVESPYFYPWTDPHMHLEIREKPEFVRASGGLELKPSEELLENFKKILSDTMRPIKPVITGEINSIRKGKYMLVKLKNGFKGYMTPLIVGSKSGIGFIDAGLPYYGHGLLISLGNGIVIQDTVKLHDITIGYVDQRYHQGLIHFRTSRKVLRVLLNGSRIKGVGSYIGFQYVKIVVTSWAGIDYRESDIVRIEFKGIESSRASM